MKINYDSAVKFYSESTNKTQLDLAYIEIDRFLSCFHNYKSYYDLDIASNYDLIKNLSVENR